MVLVCYGKSEHGARMAGGKRTLGLKERGAGCRDVVDEDDRATADANEVVAHKCVAEVGKARTAFLGARLRFGLASTREEVVGEFKHISIVMLYQFKHEEFTLIVPALAAAARMERDGDKQIFFVRCCVKVIAELGEDLVVERFSKDLCEASRIFVLKAPERALDHRRSVVKGRTDEGMFGRWCHRSICKASVAQKHPACAASGAFVRKEGIKNVCKELCKDVHVDKLLY